MAGFPTRPSRAAFGPKWQNRGPVRRPEQDVGAAAMNLLCWQAAGAGVAGALAWALLRWDGATLSLAASGEAWDSDGLVVPAVVRASAGVYVVTYAATYPDADAVAVATSLRGGHATAQATAPIVGAVEMTDPRTAKVRLWDLTTGTPVATDATVLVSLR